MFSTPSLTNIFQTQVCHVGQWLGFFCMLSVSLFIISCCVQTFLVFHILLLGCHTKCFHPSVLSLVSVTRQNWKGRNSYIVKSVKLSPNSFCQEWVTRHWKFWRCWCFRHLLSSLGVTRQKGRGVELDVRESRLLLLSGTVIEWIAVCLFVFCSLLFWSVAHFHIPTCLIPPLNPGGKWRARAVLNG